ncbi:tetraacyldisaccharide 4'-kinase [Spirosoma koreense]
MNQILLKWLLMPFGGLYGLVVRCRNWLYDSHLFQSVRPQVYSIGIGNLTVGGTGKTPMIEFLIKRSLKSETGADGATATLSRGYGRKTRGFRIATAADTAETIGDEPRQLYRKFAPMVRVCVGERRVKAIGALLQAHPETQQVLLDDAFQHRAVRPHLTILLMDYNRPFYNDHPFPAGRLREPRIGARRADAVVVTKCPANLWATEQQRIKDQIQRYTRLETPIFFASLQYGRPVSFATGQPLPELREVVLLSGLANADPLEQYVRQAYTLHRHYRFADHYPYTRPELAQLVGTLPPGTSVLTTEKDWVKLDALLTPAERMAWPLAYLPIATQFLPDQASAFDQFLAMNSLKNR